MRRPLSADTCAEPVGVRGAHLHAPRRTAAWIAVGTGLVLLAGCTGSEVVGLDVMSADSSRLVELTAASPLQAEVRDDTACFWVTVPDGSVISVVWPVGSTAHTNPLRVLDAAGEEIAREGDTGLVLGGTPNEALAGCHAGSTRFDATEVSRP